MYPLFFLFLLSYLWGRISVSWATNTLLGNFCCNIIPQFSNCYFSNVISTFPWLEPNFKAVTSKHLDPLLAHSMWLATLRSDYEYEIEYKCNFSNYCACFRSSSMTPILFLGLRLHWSATGRSIGSGNVTVLKGTSAVTN